MAAVSQLPRHHAAVTSQVEGAGSVRVLAGARLVSEAGSWAAQIALAAAVYARTHSPGWVSLAVLASVGAAGLVSPLAGHLADTFDRRRVMVVAESMGAVSFGLMCLTHRPGPLVGLALVASLAHAAFDPASGAAIPNLVSEEHLAWANGTLAAAGEVAILVGPLAGGAVVATLGAGAVFGANAVSFLISAFLISRVRRPFQGERSSDLEGMTAGFRAILRSRALIGLTVMMALAFISFGVALVADLPLAVHFHAGSTGYGAIATSWGIGSLAGTLIARRTVSAARERSALIGSCLVMSVSFLAPVLSPWFALILASCTVGGFGQGFFFVPYYGVVQRSTPDRIRSRVLAGMATIQETAYAAAMVATGFLVRGLGPQPVYLVPLVALLLGAGVVGTLL
jgi:MFS family permease